MLTAIEENMVKIVREFLKENDAHPKSGDALFNFLSKNKAGFGQYILDEMITWMWENEWFRAVNK